jgi:DNA-binding FrmR family transcriptional regulator
MATTLIALPPGLLATTGNCAPTKIRKLSRSVWVTGGIDLYTIGGYGFTKVRPEQNHGRSGEQSVKMGVQGGHMANIDHETDGVHGYIHRKDDYLKRLTRIEGQARGLQRMVAEEKYCIDILTQVSAMTKALESVALGLLEEHLSHCVVEAARRGGAEADAKVKEASDAITRLVRS